MNLGERLTAKLGPLPVWAWGAIGGAIIVGFMYWSQLRNRTTAATVTSPDGGTASSSLDTWAQVYSGQGGGTTAVVGGTQTVVPDPTNDQYEAQAFKIGTALGFAPAAVQSAVRTFLNGGELDDRSERIVNAVLGQLGTPPEGAPSVAKSEANRFTDEIQRLYRTKLGRDASEDEQAAWASSNLGDVEYVAQQIDASPERGKIAFREAVRSQYQVSLGRLPSDEDVRYWEGKTGGSIPAVVEAIKTSPEAQAR